MTAPGVRGHVAWVVLLAVGFWVIAAAMVAALTTLGVGILTYAPDAPLPGVAALVIAAGLALGLIPPLAGARRARSQKDDTPPLDAAAHPRLQTLVRDVASGVGAAAPDALYLFHDANAFASVTRPRAFAAKVSEVGIGLPILAALTCDETRAVIAHEMGHHIAGDVRLGPWVRRTRDAIGRATDRLEGSSFWLHIPFLAYAELFRRTSTSISRAQELSADAVAARLAGPVPTASALRKIERLSLLWHAYFEGEVLPILSRGRNPPLLEGFELYRQAAAASGTPAARALAAATEGASRPRFDDTHPPLDERLRALGEPSPISLHAESALSLLDDVAREEERVLQLLIVPEKRATMKPVAWSEVAAEVFLPMWREMAREHEEALRRHAPLRSLPDALADWEPLAEATRRGPAILSPEAERRRVVSLASVWLLVSLADVGFTLGAPPGLAVSATRDGKALEPFERVQALAKREASGADWGARCAEWGL